MINEKIKLIVDLNQISLWLSIFWILFNPIFWNFMARKEYSTKFLTKLFNSNYKACYFLGIIIFIIGLIRDYHFKKALENQPKIEILNQFLITKLISKILFLFGSILVLSSMWVLGITGTYLGDYFEIYMKNIITSFPFNLTSSPMYHGSTLCFLSTALSYRSPAGIMLSALVYFVYKMALKFEDPFTANIYLQRHKKSK